MSAALDSDGGCALHLLWLYCVVMNEGVAGEALTARERSGGFWMFPASAVHVQSKSVCQVRSGQADR